MRGIASAQLSPGSRTCIVVGSLDPVEGIDLRGFQFLLWFTRTPAVVPDRFGVPAERLSIQPVNDARSSDLDRAIDSLIIKDSVNLPTVLLTTDVAGAAGPLFLPVVDAIVAQCEGHRRARVTRQKAGFQWQSHLLQNVSGYAERRVPAAWAGALDGMPAFVCGSGPSLDASGAALARIAGQGVILAADSALGALSRMGICADFAVSVDAVKTPEKCLPPDCLRPRRLVLSTISPPSWAGAVGGQNVTFLSSNQMTEGWLHDLGIPKTHFEVQGNCGITAVELALQVGCRPIYLFGMDNAVDGKGSGRLHQRHYESGIKRNTNYPKIPGNYQPEIQTPFLREWRMLDSRCAALPAGLIVNVIDRGARISNTTLVHPDELRVTSACATKPERLARLAAPSAAGEKLWYKVAKRMRHTAVAASNLLTEASNAARRGHHAAAVRALADAYRDADFRLLMGNYALKVMPHLVSTTNGQTTIWRELINENQQLVALAKTIH